VPEHIPLLLIREYLRSGGKAQACSHKKMQGHKKQGVYGYVQFVRDLAVAAFLQLSVKIIRGKRNSFFEPND
jgi:hypothetical protein